MTGNYRTRMFTDLFPSEEDFTDAWEECGLYESDLFAHSTTISKIFYLLYARYGNSHLAYTDETQFAYQMWSIITTYGPNWEKEVDVQKALRALTEDDIIQGGLTVYNHAYNPATAPSTDAPDLLPYVNEQNTTNRQKSKVEAYANLMVLLKNDITAEFLSKFRHLFLTIVAPDYPLWFITEVEEDN